VAENRIALLERALHLRMLGLTLTFLLPAFGVFKEQAEAQTSSLLQLYVELEHSKDFYH